MDTAQHPLAPLLRVPSEPPELDELPQSAYETFARHADLLEDFYAGADVREEWRERIERRAKLPAWEEVLAFVDLTALGTAKDFLVFGRAGLYYRQIADRHGTRFQPWHRVLAHRAGVDEGLDFDQIRIGEALYSLAGSAVDHDGLADMIDDLGDWAPLAELSPEEVAYLDALTPASGDPIDLADIAAEYVQLDRLHVSSDIDDELNGNAREFTVLSDDEYILALLDCSADGGATDVLAFAANGVHHHHQDDRLTPQFWSWPEVEASAIAHSLDDGPQIFIRGHAHTVVGGAQELAAIGEMVVAMAAHMCPVGTPPHDLSYLADTTIPSDMEPDEGVEAVPTVRGALDADEFIESAFFFGHSFGGVQFAGAIAEDTAALVAQLGPLPGGESIVAAVDYDTDGTNLFLITTAGVRYWADSDTGQPLLTWDAVRAILEDESDGEEDEDHDEVDSEVAIGDIVYSFEGSDVDADEVAVLLLFLAYRAPAGSELS